MHSDAFYYSSLCAYKKTINNESISVKPNYNKCLHISLGELLMKQQDRTHTALYFKKRNGKNITISDTISA